jgi:hypothetical protein
MGIKSKRGKEKKVGKERKRKSKRAKRKSLSVSPYLSSSLLLILFPFE